MESGSVSGPGSVEFAFGANGTLDATISSTLLAAPRTLVGLTNPDPEFTFPWTNAIPGTHTLTARAYYGSGRFVISAPVTITVSAGGFVGWLAVNPGIPADRRGPLDSNGPLNMPNLTAYAMGLNPLTAVATDLPHVAAPDPAAGTMHFLYRRAKNLTGATLTPRYSANLQGWSNAAVLSETVVEDADTWERVDALIQVAPGSRGFLILAVQTVP